METNRVAPASLQEVSLRLISSIEERLYSFSKAANRFKSLRKWFENYISGVGCQLGFKDIVPGANSLDLIVKNMAQQVPDVCCLLNRNLLASRDF